MRTVSLLALTGISFASLALVSCADDTTRTYRIASVGSQGSGGSDGGNGNGNGNGGSNNGGGNIIVAGGNVLVGAAAQFAALTGATNGLVPLGGTVNATVTAILGNSGHTLVELGNGTSLLLDGNGGHLGDVLALDLGSGRVIGGPAGSPLIGVNVLAANPVNGSLATVSAASGNQLVGVTVLDTALGTGNGNNILIAPAIAPALGLGATVNGTVNATLGGLTGH
jgi:hypothetical protein